MSKWAGFEAVKQLPSDWTVGIRRGYLQNTRSLRYG